MNYLLVWNVSPTIGAPIDSASGKMIQIMTARNISNESREEVDLIR